ncbi:hypothetical protein AAFF_G00030990 [Aldrovandia affinis]|uniref:Uncharacterized protein n=1 Tax=Aldrovandia affinis TaxID=143900 RepID=A0AAD7S476_9TELE|nr:hypothetical protein AAFF_G00030990 [Aldrovandia affinis]
MSFPLLPFPRYSSDEGFKVPLAHLHGELTALFPVGGSPVCEARERETRREASDRPWKSMPFPPGSAARESPPVPKSRGQKRDNPAAVAQSSQLDPRRVAAFRLHTIPAGPGVFVLSDLAFSLGQFQARC